MFTRLSVLLPFLFWILPAMHFGEVPERSPTVAGTTITLNGGTLGTPDG
jgi:hypothetical protein